MKKIIIPLVMVILAFCTLTRVTAAERSVTLAWDPSPSTNLAGYNVYYGAGCGQYTNIVNAGNTTTVTIPGLVQGVTYFFAATAYDTSELESDFSNEIVYTVPEENSLDESYLASAEYSIDHANGSIVGLIEALPADPREVGWAKDLGPVAGGQTVGVSARMFYSDSVSAPISLYVADSLTGNWLSPERVVFIDYTYGSNAVEMIVNNSCEAPRLYVSTGHRTGVYEFQRIQVSVNTPAINPTTDLYLRQLLVKQLTGLYSAEWVWVPAAGSQGYVVRLALTRSEIEKGAAGNLLYQQTLSAGQTSYRRNIDATLYNGVYLSVASLSGGVESAPWITWYLPGDIYNTADEDIPPLCFQALVDATDVNYAYTGYTSLRRVPALTPGLPAGREERTDIDNNTYAGRVSDYSFIRSQNLNARRMR